MTRRGLGAVLMGVGLVVTAIGAFGLLSGGSAGTASASPTAGPPTGTPSTTAVPPTVIPSSAPTPDTEALVRAFAANLAQQINAGTQGNLLDALDAAVIARYGAPTCAAALGTFAADPSYSIVVNAVAAPAPWDYVTDEKTTTIPDALAVDAVVTGGGINGATPSTATRTLHFHLVDGAVRWFTDCGTPLA
jgi:hypothetical protein